jgi:hypothetical protein
LIRDEKRGGEDVVNIIHIHPYTSKSKLSRHSKYHTHNHTSPTRSHPHTISILIHSTLLRPASTYISASDVHLHDVVDALAVHDGGGGADEHAGDDEGADAVMRLDARGVGEHEHADDLLMS